MGGGGVVFRADGSAEIGLGHLTRCLCLAGALRDRGWSPLFVTKRWDAIVSALVRTEGFALREIAPDASHLEDCTELVEAAQRIGALAAVLDGYRFGPDYEDTVRAAGLRLLVVDDLGGPHRADVILNQNVSATAEMYSGNEHGSLLLGPHYALVRPAFLRARRFPRVTRSHGRRVLLTLGGSDPANVTGQLIAWLKGRGCEVTAVVGAASPHVAILRSLAAQDARILESLPAEKMAGLFEWADIAVAGGGTTCLELMCVGVPVLVVILAANQVGSAEGLEKARAARNLGWHSDLTAERMFDPVNSLLGDPVRRAEMSAAGQQLVDGQGAIRVAEILGRVCHADTANR